jgi:hypothetical protein
MCCTWIFTVVSAMSSTRAISLLLMPRAISRSTSSSRGDRGATVRRGAARGFGHLRRRRRAGRRRRPLRLEGRHQLAHQFRADHRLPLRGAANGLRQQIPVDGFEQIALGAVAQRRSQVLRVFAHGEHQHARAWRHFTQAANGVHPHHAGQMVVQQDHIGLQGGHQPQASAASPASPTTCRPGPAPAGRSGHAGTRCDRPPPARSRGRRQRAGSRQSLLKGGGRMGGDGRGSHRRCLGRAAGAGGLGLLGSSMHTRVPCPRCDCTCTTAPMRWARSRMMPRPTCKESGGNLLYLKAHAIVLHLKAPARMALHPQFHPRRLGMLAHVRQGFLHHVQHLDLHIGGRGRPWPAM